METDKGLACLGNSVCFVIHVDSFGQGAGKVSEFVDSRYRLTLYLDGWFNVGLALS